MKKKTFMRHVSRMLFFAALLMPGWQTMHAGGIQNPGTHDPSVVAPWKYIGVTFDDFYRHNDDYKLWTDNNQWPVMWETSYSVDGKNNAFGYKMDRDPLRTDHTTHFKVKYELDQVIPPYAVLESQWNYKISSEGDRGKSAAHIYLFGDTIPVDKMLLYAYPGAKASNSDRANHEYVIYSWQEDRGDYTASDRSSQYIGSAELNYDNRNSSTAHTSHWTMIHLASMYAGMTSGHVQSTLHTESFIRIVYYPRFKGAGTQDSPLQIEDGEGLRMFATIVNSGIEGTENLYAVLTGDIDYTDYKDDAAMIGTSKHPFGGVFDGQGYSIKIALKTTQEYSGLFGYIQDATIKNLSIRGTLEGGRVLASLAGEARGNCSIANVISSVQITGSSTSTDLAGILGSIGDGNKSMKLNMTDCAFIGQFTGDLSKCNMSGFGYLRNYMKANVSNCYTALSNDISGKSGQNFFRKASDSGVTLTLDNCYYTHAIQGSTQGTKVSKKQMESGEVCWRLNGSKNGGTPWLQTLGKDTLPVLWEALSVFERNGSYFNFQIPLRGSGTEVDPFQIENIQNLEFFRDIVNKGGNAYCAQLVANIDLANRNWEPIGTNDLCYKGIFDGKGYVISNLSVDGYEHGVVMCGLFSGIDSGAVVKNLLLHNVTVKCSNHAGTIAGRCGDATIMNCGVTGIVKLQGGDDNGIAYAASTDSKLISCYTVYFKLSHESRKMQATHCYASTDEVFIKGCKTGELTYNLNGGELTPWVQTLGRDEYPLLRGALAVTMVGDSCVNKQFEGSSEVAFIDNTSGKDFRIIHHGGRLYEFVITMATQDGNGIQTSPNVDVMGYSNNQWVKLFSLSDVNADSLDFSRDWWGKINIEKGVTYDTKTYDRQVPTFWIRQGDHTSCKQTSILWMAPEDMTDLPAKFQLKGSAAESQYLLTSNEEETTKPGDESGLTFVDPVVGASSNVAGSQMIVVSAAYNAYSIGLWDATDNYFICAKEISGGSMSIQEYLSPVECNHNIVALLFTRNVATDAEGKSDTTYVNYSYPFVQKPTHSILRTNINTNYNANNLLEWAIAFPKDSDMLDDQYLLARSYSPTYSDLSTLVALNANDTSYTTLENDTLFGWFSVVDTTYVDHASLVPTLDTLSIFDTWNISDKAKAILGVYKYPSRYLYYQAYRPVVTSLWAHSEAYKARWKVLQRDVLPTVDSVRVIKDADFDSNHKVKVRVILNNPYPWDLVDNADRSEVMLEAKKQLFGRRMFQWDTNATIQIERFSTSDEYDEGNDVILKYMTIEGDQVKQDTATGAYYVEFADVVSMPFVHYYYKAIVGNKKSAYAICEHRNKPVVSSESIYCEQFGGISNFEATRGTVQGAVGLTWLADEFASTTLTLKRREYQRGYKSEQPLADWTTMTAIGGSAMDDKASAAVVNEYILTITTKYRNHIYTESDTTYGYAGYYGSLDGRVKMNNGVNMPGDVHVVVNSDKPFEIQEVQSPKGEVILPACQFKSIKKTLATDMNGSYQLDSVPYYGSGRVYTVYATCEGATFVSPTGSAATIDLTYEDGNYDYTNIDFTCSDTKHFSGRILYTNSTVPVREVYFKVNGTILRDAEGEPVKTDAMGNFSFNVPRMEVTIQAFRPGHRMSNDGYILGGESGDQKKFTPTHDYDGLIIDDETKVRLVGRVAGGVIQGVKPMGFGLGHNNLGDSITLVLTLEGDHTSYLYFDKQNPDKTSNSEQFTQRVRTDMGSEQRIPTNATFEAKRIVVKADNKTGEFCLDLFPTKYVVSQIYANGYSTLYSAGEGLTVLDLTDSVGLHTHFSGGDWTEYDGSFRKIYHAPVQVDLLQLRDNQYQAIYGEKTMEVGMLSGKQQMQLSWKDSTETAQYALGYPLYKGGKQYFYLVSAYEPYYYNNVTTGEYERVPMVGYEVMVNNGLSTFIDEEDDEEDEEEDGLILSAAGTAMFSITPNNTTFSLNSDYDGLRHLSASVNINDYNYESEPIAGYVTGERNYQVDVMAALEGDPQILDYIRDPYGSGSYAYRSSGTTYNWSRSYEKEEQDAFAMELELGVGLISEVGWMIGLTTEYQVTANCDLNVVSRHKLTYKDGEFTLSLNEQLSTSDDPLDQGAIADIYLGSVSTADVVKYQAINVVDSLTYQALLPAMETGVARLVAQGQNEVGRPYYLVICGGVTWQPGEERTFAYSQRHILNTLIPQLEARRAEALRLAGSSAEATQMAATSGKTCYYANALGEYTPVYTSTMKVKKDTVAMLDNQINAWKKVIADNERIKYEAMSNKPDLKYSVAGTTIEHSEEASTYYRIREVDGPKPVTGSVGVGSSNSTTDSEGKDSLKGDALKCAGFVYSISLGGQFDREMSNEMGNYTSIEGASGFVISADDNCYYDIDVYYQNDSTLVLVDDEFKTDVNKYEGGSGLDDYKITNGTQSMTSNNTYVHNYIFVMRGGASREPWLDMDSTQCYFPDGENSVPLGTRTLKIDKPVLYVENPVVNNLPQDEKAVFTLHLSNETELDANVKNIWSSLYLRVMEGTNPHGAKLTIDGEPLREAMEFLINPGESVTKTLEVERGGKPYDYEDIVLELTDEVYFQSSPASISVHYLPTSTPVTLTLPTQNFLINTLSQKDEDGKYYIPVQIEGFSTTKYDNFDHIELQYKRQTDGEDQWVNLCSYYANELLYKVATGNKAMIETEGKISDIRFYGEKDPVEQKYDLRAVSFCRLGNGYTTRISSVISGTKDTRCPEVFGLPKPTDGILDFDDVISLPFTEPIAYNYLDETANFSVQGFTNNSDVDNSVAMYFSGSENQKAVSEVERVLNAMDFSVEMNVRLDAAADSVAFIAIEDDFSENDDNTFVFGYSTQHDALIAGMNGQLIYSMPLRATYGLTLTSAMTHVGMTYTIADSTVRFYVSEQQVDVLPKYKDLKPVCHANGVVNLGVNYQGKMNNIRLWSKALNAYEMSSKYKKQLTQNEAHLLDYWPADEASGTQVVDKANGATLALTNVSWSLPDGYSVALDHQTMDVLNDQALKYARNKKEDYTISFYFKVDQLDGDANLFAAGSDALEETGMDKMRIRFIDGVLYLVSEDQQIAFGDDNKYASDGAWHYLAVSVNHAQNKASLFIDGQVVNQLDANRIGGVTSSGICYGDTLMAAHIDQVQMWSMSLPASYIKTYYNAGLSGKEKELQIYLPFEQEEMNAQGTMYTAFSPLNHVIVESTGEIAGDTVVNESLLTADNKVISPVRSSTGIENLPFTWKSTDNELQITINKSNAEINNQQISLVVRRVEDLNGNPMQNAQMWTTYVNRNVLTWIADSRIVTLPYGSDTIIAVGLKNTSGRTLGYTIDCTSPYITLEQTMGTIAPLTTKATAISISDGLAPGVYQATINLTDEDGLCSPLPLYVRVVATAPNWQVTTDPSYNQSMNVIAQVKKQNQGNWVLDMCQKDEVAAFIGKECVGKASIRVDMANNTSYLYLTVRGKGEVAGKTIEFRLWDALAGQTYVLNANPEVTFAAQSIVGADKPVELRAHEMRIQTLSLNPGWNWVSLYVDPFADKGLNNLFSNQKQLTTNDVFRTPFGNTFATFQSTGWWDATMDNMEILKNNVYHIYAQKAATVEVSGSLYAKPTITLDFTKSEWAEMAYLSDKSMPIRQVLGDFVPGSEKAPAGTIIKGYEDFAIATTDGTWMGSLEYLRPGEGYFVRRNGLRDSVTLSFTNTASASAPARHLTSSASGYAATSPTMMPLVATWSDFQEGDVLLAMVGKEVVAVSEATDYLFFVSLHANQGETIQFAKVRDGEVVAVTSRGLKYDAEGQAGTVEQPYLIDFTQEEENAPIYDILGMKVDNLNLTTPRVLIQGNKKVLNK